MAYDVGAVLQNLVLNALSHYGHTPDPEARAEYQEYVLGLARAVWNEFAQKLDAVWWENARGDLMPPRYWESAGGPAALTAFRQAMALNYLRVANESWPLTREKNREMQPASIQPRRRSQKFAELPYAAIPPTWQERLGRRRFRSDSPTHDKANAPR